MQRKQDTNQPPHHAVAQRSAAPSRPPSAASATAASLSIAASPAWSQSSCCPCPRFKEFQCGQDHPGSENSYKHEGFESNLAVVHLLRSRVGVFRCKVCNKPVVLSHVFTTEDIFHQQESKTDMKMFSFGPLSPHNDCWEKYSLIHIRCLKHRENRGGQNAKGSEPPCKSLCIRNSLLRFFLHGFATCLHPLLVFPLFSASIGASTCKIDAL